MLITYDLSRYKYTFFIINYIRSGHLRWKSFTLALGRPSHIALMLTSHKQQFWVTQKFWLRSSNRVRLTTKQLMNSDKLRFPEEFVSITSGDGETMTQSLPCAIIASRLLKPLLSLHPHSSIIYDGCWVVCQVVGHTGGSRFHISKISDQSFPNKMILKKGSLDCSCVNQMENSHHVQIKNNQLFYLEAILWHHWMTRGQTKKEWIEQLLVWFDQIINRSIVVYFIKCFRKQTHVHYEWNQ